MYFHVNISFPCSLAMGNYDETNCRMGKGAHMWQEEGQSTMRARQGSAEAQEGCSAWGRARTNRRWREKVRKEVGAVGQQAPYREWRGGRLADSRPPARLDEPYRASRLLDLLPPVSSFSHLVIKADVGGWSWVCIEHREMAATPDAVT